MKPKRRTRDRLTQRERRAERAWADMRLVQAKMAQRVVDGRAITIDRWRTP